MNRNEITERILAAKHEKGLTFADIAKPVGGHPVWVTAALLGQTAISAEEAERAATVFGLGKDVEAALQERGTSDGPAVPVDPVIYRLYSFVQQYGTTIKALIQEMFGRGVMSAVDFNMDVQKRKSPNGDRVVITLDGKFLPYQKW